MSLLTFVRYIAGSFVKLYNLYDNILESGLPEALPYHNSIEHHNTPQMPKFFRKMYSPIKKRMKQDGTIPAGKSASPRGKNALLTIIVDSRSQAIFEVSSKALVEKSRLISSRFEQQKAQPAVRQDIQLPSITVSDFADFVRWLETGRVLPLHHYGVRYAIEGNARRLVNAIELGITLHSVEYQLVATMELHVLGRNLQHPEELVDRIFNVTLGAHPARKLIVEIVAAKICAAWGGRPYVTARDKSHTQIDNPEFWVAFDAHCRKNKGRCVYPANLS